MWAEPGDVVGVWITSNKEMIIPYVEVKSWYDDDPDLAAEMSEALEIQFRTPEALWHDGEYHYLFAYEAAENIEDYWDGDKGLFVEFSFKLEGENDDELIKFPFFHVVEQPNFFLFLLEIGIIIGICIGVSYVLLE